MKILMLTTYCTPDEAFTIYQLLGELREAFGEVYREELEQVCLDIHETQRHQSESDEGTWIDDEIPF